MCEIFPEFSSCCLCVSLRIGMIFISVLAIMTGVIGLSGIVHKMDLDYHEVYDNIMNKIKKPEDVMVKATTVATTGISIFSCVFMFTGLVLLFGTLFDNEGIVQVFVWLTFLNIILGLNIIIVISVECIVKKTCLLSELDWLSGSASIVLTVCYLSLWLYFISVANSYVIGYAA